MLSFQELSPFDDKIIILFYCIILEVASIFHKILYLCSRIPDIVHSYIAMLSKTILMFLR